MPRGLDSLRDLWIHSARALIHDFKEATPAKELGGILGRAGELLDTLGERLDELEELSFEDSDPDAIEEALMGARRIPRCVLAFSAELERSEEDRSWTSLRAKASTLRSALRGIQHAWLLADMGVDLASSLPEPKLEALARLGRAARLDQLGLLGDTSSDETAPLE